MRARDRAEANSLPLRVLPLIAVSAFLSAAFVFSKARGNTVQVIVRSSYQINVRGLRVYNPSLRSSAKMIIAH